MDERSNTCVGLAIRTLLEARNGKTSAEAGRLLGAALWWVCEAAASEPYAVIVPHPLLKTTAVRRSPAAYKETENDRQR